MIRRVVMLLAALAVLTTGTVCAAPAATPAAAVDSLYRWYFSDPKPGGWMDHLAGARPYLEPSLYALLSNVLAQQKAHPGEALLDFDPFANAQQLPTGYKIGKTSLLHGATAVSVAVTFPPKLTTHLTAIVRKAPSGWQVSNLLYGNNFDLRSALRQSLK
jgi:hypothetical protein